MRNVNFWKYITIHAALFVAAHAAFCQTTGVNTDEIESLIDEWNFAHNTRNLHSFEKVYAGRLIFYNENITKSKAISIKRQLFQKNPRFRQRITTEIRYTRHSAGVVKCAFTREVFENAYWKKYSSYLLVRDDNNRYSIIGESDIATDRALKYKQKKVPDPVATENKEKEEEPVDSVIAFTPPVLPPMEHPDSLDSDLALAPDVHPDTMNTQLSINDIGALFSDPSSLGMITIPRGYVFILVGMLALGGLMIFIADSIQSRKRRRVKAPVSHGEAEHIVRDFKVQAAFEAFVITLFDPLYFRYSRPKAEYLYAGKAIQAEKGPDLVFDYHQKEMHVRFAITCQYYQHTARNEVQLLSGERQDLMRQFEAEREMDVYYVLGFGGRPDDPKELFFIPAKEVHSEYMTRAQLKHYSKSGMFYFNRRAGRIQ